MPSANAEDPILMLESVQKSFRTGDKVLHILKDIDFSVGRGEVLSIVGPSGSGKTTLLGLCAGLDRVTSGKVYLSGYDLEGLDEDRRAAVRNESVGFIFQNFQLIPTLTTRENVMVPLELRGSRGAASRADELLERVGLGDRVHHYPRQLSGGEQQRVSLARAFANNPAILFADEPTGNLDDDTSERVENLLFEINREQGTTLLVVTHDHSLAEKTQRIIRLQGGHLVSDQKVAHA
jgi:putative ABC transport system ATP-binding protein